MKESLKIGDFAKLNKVRPSTIKFYSEIELLPYEQDGKRLAKRFDPVKATERLKKILSLRKQGKTIPEIKKLIASKGQ
jgi:DNA-binding transcriptional MerR regulator